MFMASPTRTHLKTKMQTAMVVTYLREKGPSTKANIIKATGLDSKRFSNLTQTWRNTPSNDTPFKHSGVKKGSLWAAPEAIKPSAVVEITKEKIVEVPVGNLDALECAISVGNLIQFMNDNGISTMQFQNGMNCSLTGVGITFENS